MKLDKKTLRSLSLAFFISGIIVAGANIFADDSAAQSTSEEETTQLADNIEEEADSQDNEEASTETTNNDISSAEENNEAESSEETDTSTIEDTTEVTDTTTENDADSDSQSEETQTTDTIEVVVNPNEDSYSVVDKLTQAGIIEDADDFNEFLRYYDYARRIQPGTKELSPAMSYEEIAQILTTY